MGGALNSIWATAVVVLYNEKIENSSVLVDLKQLSSEIKTVVCDNSTSPCNKASDVWDGAVYLDMGGNVGLSAAYNRAMDYIQGDVVCIFDDDTTIEEPFFPNLKKSLDGDWDIMMPLVYSGDSLMSPARCRGLRPRPIDIDAASSCRFLTGINSGMVIRKAVYDTLRYDERLFLDFVDHQFCKDAHEAGLRITVNKNMVLHQTYSLITDDCSSALNRFKVFARDVRMFYRHTWTQRLYCRIMLGYRALKQACRYKSFSFLREMLYV